MCESIYLSGEQELLLDCAFAGKQLPHCKRNPPAVLCVTCFSGDYLLLSCAAARQPGSGVGSVEAVLSLCIRGLAWGSLSEQPAQAYHTPETACSRLHAAVQAA